jgi:hypothetical protein
MKYHQRSDNEGFEVPSGQIYRLACCDCGLIHDFVFVSEDGKPIGIAARRNSRATAQRRKSIKRKALAAAQSAESGREEA